MPLSAGTKLGPYEILVRIGAGGMGEVYKARDTRLARIVAIKVSKTEFSERFEREAHAIAQLNHPHICQLYDVGPNYLVMEYVEGAPLKGPLPLEKAAEYAGQILDALDAAHKKGITHRDLKPANILITEQGIKLLDFGLAKQTGPVKETDATVTQGLTGRGQIVGTLQYMSPEQLQSKEVDARSDLFSFGCVLYEILTGKRAFEGANAASVIAAILEREPAPLNVAPPLERVIRICVAKDPERRFQTALDLKRALSWAVEQQPAMASKPSRRWPWIAAAGLFAVMAAAEWSFRSPGSAEHNYRLSVLPPEGTSFVFSAASGSHALSPDGRTLAFVGETQGATHLWLRPLDSTTARRLEGTDQAYGVLWSPDGRFLAFPTPGKLRRIELATGTVRDLCLATDVRGITWNQQGTIVFAKVNSGLSQVSSDGGEPTPLTVIDFPRTEESIYWPQFLPDGRHLLYAIRTAHTELSGTYVASLGVKPEDQGRLQVLRANRNAWYTAEPGGHGGFLLFLRDKALFAQRFDADRLRTDGEPLAVAEDVGGMVVRMSAGFSAAPNGALAYWSGEALLMQLNLVSREGATLRPVGEPGMYTAFNLSHDDKQVALSAFGADSPTQDVWLLDVERGVSSRFTSDPAMDQNAAWSPDDKEIVFSSTRKGAYNLYRKKLVGGQEERVGRSDQRQWANSWSANGNRLLFSGPLSAVSQSDVWAVPAGGGDPIPLANTQFDEYSATASPNGRWLAFVSNDTGAYEVYVQSFPKAGTRQRISAGGGFFPQWRADGKELYYSTPDNTLMAIEVHGDGPEFAAGTPQALFPLKAAAVYSLGTFWQPMHDGRRFLVLRTAEPAPGKPITIVTNWQAALKK
jgi:eukaryotic-like serine/threonine-protein kinase